MFLKNKTKTVRLAWGFLDFSHAALPVTEMNKK